MTRMAAIFIRAFLDSKYVFSAPATTTTEILRKEDRSILVKVTQKLCAMFFKPLFVGLITGQTLLCQICEMYVWKHFKMSFQSFNFFVSCWHLCMYRLVFHLSPFRPHWYGLLKWLCCTCPFFCHI